MNIERIFESTDWYCKWAVADFTIIGSSFNSHGYVDNMVRRYKHGLIHNFFVFNRGLITCYQSREENEKIGNFVDRRIKHQPDYAAKLSGELLDKAKCLRLLLGRPPSTLFDKDKFDYFSKKWHEIMPAFVAVNRCGKLLVDPKYKKRLHLIERTRVKTESILIEADQYIRRFLKLVAKKEKIEMLNLTVLSWDELLKYVHANELPKPKAIRSRWPKCGYVYSGEDVFLSRPEADKLVKKIAEAHQVKSGYVNGQGAFPGIVRGRVRIVLDPRKAVVFKQGQILIAAMTRPDYLSLIKKAGAIITDAGGVLCHAAISSREFRIPCVVGTQTATRAFRNGDLVEVDATRGIVRKL